MTWITDFILNLSITNKMESETIVSLKNQAFVYAIKEFYRVILQIQENIQKKFEHQVPKT